MPNINIIFPDTKYSTKPYYWYMYSNKSIIHITYFNEFRISAGGSYGRGPMFNRNKSDYFYMNKDICTFKDTDIPRDGWSTVNLTDTYLEWYTNNKDLISQYDAANPHATKKIIYVDTKEKCFNMISDKYGWTCKAEELKPPTPEGGEQTDKTCSNTGQFGGGGTPLKDIKLFLYANNVTKGTIKLSKPQVEVGTFATDWRPNPSDYVHVNNSNFKRINGIAMQHSDDNGKNYLEIQTKDGHVFGIDTWGGTQKLLEQQQAEIDELKKLVQTLSTKINV